MEAKLFSIMLIFYQIIHWSSGREQISDRVEKKGQPIFEESGRKFCRKESKKCLDCMGFWYGVGFLFACF